MRTDRNGERPKSNGHLQNPEPQTDRRNELQAQPLRVLNNLFRRDETNASQQSGLQRAQANLQSLAPKAQAELTPLIRMTLELVLLNRLPSRTALIQKARSHAARTRSRNSILLIGSLKSKKASGPMLRIPAQRARTHHADSFDNGHGFQHPAKAFINVFMSTVEQPDISPYLVLDDLSPMAFTFPPTRKL